MDILASPSLRAGSVAWLEQPGQWTLTVVCKLTYALAPGVAAIAPEQEDVNEQDNHWDDDLERSVYAPGDLAPFKQRPEVMLVGSAFAPRGQPARALFVRLVVGELDKSIEVFGQRARAGDGSLHDGPRWTQTPLRYERAAGGPGSWNPVGVPEGAMDTYGRRALPSLQPPGLSIDEVSAGDVGIAPIGFGPLAATWPSRREKLRHRASGWSDLGWNEEPLGEAFDATFFQAAPLDQRVDVLRPDEQLVLENLHPDHPRLVTRLPGVRPRARVEADDLPSWELALVADTLWIDTNRAVCTLTWRGQVPLDRRDQPGVVLLTLEEPGRPARSPSSPGADGAAVEDAPKPARSSRPSIDPERSDDADLVHTVVDDSALSQLPPVSQDKPVLPFQRASHTAGEAPAPAGASRSSKVPDDEEDRRGETARLAVPARHRMPTWLDPPPSAGARAESAPPRPTPAPPPPVSMLIPSSPAPSSAGERVPPPPISSLGVSGDRSLAAATYGGVLESSNAAAGSSNAAAGSSNAAAGSSTASPPAARAEAASSVASQASRALVELLWFDAAKVPRLREVTAWAPLFPARPPPPASPGEAAAAEASERAERADVQRVLARATPVIDVEGALLDAASEDGALEAPLVVAAGELELPFDEIAMLDALLGAAASLAAGDKKLKEVLDVATEVMKTPLGGSPGVAAGLVARVRDAWSKANRLLPADYLDVNTRRLLLEKRSYQRRQLSDEVWIRALLALPGESAPVPTYLPEALGRWLPLFARFPARVVAEAVPQQDQYESHPAALRVMALARVVTARARGR